MSRANLNVVLAGILMGAPILAAVLALADREWLLAVFPFLVWAVPERLLPERVRELLWAAACVVVAGYAINRGHLAYGVVVLVMAATWALIPPWARRGREGRGEGTTA